MFTKIKNISAICLATTLLLSLAVCEASVIRSSSESMPVNETNANLNVASTTDIKQKYTGDLYYFEYKTKRLYTNKELNTIDIKNYVFNTVNDFEAIDKVQHLLYLQTTGITGGLIVGPFDEGPDLFCCENY